MMFPKDCDGDDDDDDDDADDHGGKEALEEKTTTLPTNSALSQWTTTTNASSSVPSSFLSSSLCYNISFFLKELNILTNLSIPQIIVTLSFVAPQFLSASFIGRHLGPLFLDAFALASLTGNVFQGTLLQGLFNASATLSPQAFGAGNYREVGLLAIRGYVVAMVLVVVPLNGLLLAGMGPLLQFLGQDVQASTHAWHFYGLYSLSYPFYTLFAVCWKFLSAQEVLQPLVGATLVSALLVLPMSLHVLGHWLGFLGVALATTLYYACQSLFVVLWLWIQQPHHTATWPGLSSWREALAPKPLWSYLSLGLGGILAYLEWVYWEAMTLLVGTLGVTPLSAHAIPTQVLDVANVFPLGLGLALSIRLGTIISQDVAHCRTMAMGSLVATAAVYGVAAVLLYQARFAIFRLFLNPNDHNNDDVWDLCHDIWWDACIYYFVLSLYAIVIGISIGLGLQWTLGCVTVISLWMIGMPAAYYFAIMRHGGIRAIWRCIWPPYVLITVWMCLEFAVRDWNEISRQVQLRETVAAIRIDKEEEELLLAEHNDDDPGDPNSNPSFRAIRTLNNTRSNNKNNGSGR